MSYHREQALDYLDSQGISYIQLGHWITLLHHSARFSLWSGLVIDEVNKFNRKMTIKEFIKRELEKEENKNELGNNKL